jgi:hypothetical protein
MKMTESIETEMDKGALEPRKKRECVSQKEVFDSDEDEAWKGKQSSKEDSDVLYNSIVIVDISSDEEVWIDLTEQGDGDEPLHTNNLVSNSSQSISQLPAIEVPLASPVALSKVCPDTVSETVMATNASTEKRLQSPVLKEPSSSVSTQKSPQNEIISQRKVEVIMNQGKSMMSVTSLGEGKSQEQQSKLSANLQQKALVEVGTNPSQHVGMSSKMSMTTNCQTEDCHLDSNLKALFYKVQKAHLSPLRCNYYGSRQHIDNHYHHRIRVGNTNGMSSHVFREITRQPRISDLRYRKLIIFVDLDNWAGVFKHLASSLPRGVFVWGFYGGKNNWHPPSCCKTFESLLAERGFYLHPKCGTRKDAADFALCMQAGVIHAELPTSIPFVVLSGDKGFEELEHQLKQGDRPRKAHFVNPHQMDPQELYKLLSRLVNSQRY